MEPTNALDDLISRMTLEEKVGALFTFGFCGTLITPTIREAIQRYHCGGFRISPPIKTFGSYVAPGSGETMVAIKQGMDFKHQMVAPYATASQYRGVLEELQRIAAERSTGIPLHFSYDNEGGGGENFNIGKYIRWPSQMGLRAAGDPKYAYQTALLAGRQARAMGLSFVHSPVLDINLHPDNPGCGTRAFSDRADEVTAYGEQMARGYIEAGIVPTGKHFPNVGDNSQDSHYGLVRVSTDRETLLSRDLAPYRELIRQDLLPAIMPAHIIYEALDSEHVATVSKKILTDLLRGELGFTGVVTTDSMTMAGVAARYGIADSCALALQAGADLVLMKADNHLNGDCFETVVRYVEEGKISESEIDAKVERVLSLKKRFGWMGAFAEESGEDPDAFYSSREAVELREELVRKTTLIARDTDGLLPLPEGKRFLLIEQERICPNDLDNHSAMLYEECLKYSQNVLFLEVGYEMDEEDRRKIRAAVAEHDCVVMTNFYSRGHALNVEVIDEIADDESKELILITNTPYPVSLPASAGTVVIAFGEAPEHQAFIASVLFGRKRPEGVWPVAYEIL